MRRVPSAGHAFVALGANLPGAAGAPVRTLQGVLRELAKLASEALIVSSFYESFPKDCPPGSPPFVNAVAALLPLPGAEPLALLKQLHAIEESHGRQRSGLRNEARTLDLDLLAYPGIHCATPILTLPHPRAHERRFVLEPWIEIAGEDWQLQGKSLGEWLSACRDPALHRLQASSADS